MKSLIKFCTEFEIKHISEVYAGMIVQYRKNPPLNILEITSTKLTFSIGEKSAQTSNIGPTTLIGFKLIGFHEIATNI